MMKRHVCVAFLVGLLVVATGARAAAAAGTWTAPVEGCAVLTPYAAAYGGMTHRGVDLAADPGSTVAAPADGTVSFAGQVPADGGGTCGAVTIEFPDGLRATLLPLAEVWVAAGDRVAAGETVGAVAASGDSSASEPHLHVGLRRGDTYLDPTGLLPAAPVAPGPAEPVELPDTGGDGGSQQQHGGSSALVPGSALAPAGTVPGGVRVVTPASSASSPAEAFASARLAAPAARASCIRHPVPQGSGAPVASQIVQVGPVQSGLARWTSAIAPALGAQQTPLALIAPGIAFVLIGALGLGRELAHSRAS